MLERVSRLFVHSVLHIFAYIIPRWVHTLLVKVPVSLWQLLRGHRPLTYAPQTERHISVLASQKDSVAGSATRQLFGLRDGMTYDGPLYSGHIHTIIGSSRSTRRISYERELLEAADTNPICLDWLKVPQDVAVKGIILLIPGLGNYGQTNYIQRFARCAAERGYNVCLLTPRGMGSAPLTTANITCVTFTEDIRHALRHRLQRGMLAKEYGRAVPLYAVGYSCGGSTLIKCVAEETQAQESSGGSLYSDGFPIEAMVSMIAPNDMEASADMLRTRMGKLLYAKPIFTALRKYIRKHRKALLSASDGKSEAEKAKLPLLHTDFDAAFKQIREPRDIDTHVVAAHLGYANRHMYYRDGDALQYIEKIRGVPVLCLNTRDDPIVGYAVSQSAWQGACDVNSNAVYVEVPSGGHFGFVQAPWREWSRQYSFLQEFPLNALDSVLRVQQSKKKA